MPEGCSNAHVAVLALAEILVNPFDNSFHLQKKKAVINMSQLSTHLRWLQNLAQLVLEDIGVFNGGGGGSKFNFLFLFSFVFFSFLFFSFLCFFFSFLSFLSFLLFVSFFF